MQGEIFLRHKMERQIALNGREMTFTHYVRDKYGQTSDEAESTYTIQGIFHTTNSHVIENNTEGGRVVSKPQPMVLVMYEDGEQVEKDDTVEIGTNLYKVASKNDVNGFGVAFDVSLEVVLLGG